MDQQALAQQQQQQPQQQPQPQQLTQDNQQQNMNILMEVLSVIKPIAEMVKPKSGSFKIGTPEKFTGSANEVWSEWIVKFQRYLELTQCPRDMWLPILESYLSGPADRYTSFVKKETEAHDYNIELLIPTGKQADMFKKYLYSVKMRSDSMTSLEEYNEKFSSYASKIGNMSDDDLRMHYIVGLTLSIGNKVEIHHKLIRPTDGKPRELLVSISHLLISNQEIFNSSKTTRQLRVCLVSQVSFAGFCCKE
ncbi:hypothetical protein PPL_08030 [Heterostelium album PN500]|uniref:Gag protein n=1 Tax=Heterostelium pallidum (strain ATCC 26659 / Pp 5 / PN500) TaxID=670386 RepID=D3BHM6_HETP5|nr:hypothetical protein PPL_08030 [Heterostelium album PN500]EFA79203.1 hypothetical protein PPL_08030 [Heterostelium album PN500]|eukprot:XP_020431324.1 hypothetical protein PPL_08030 [Heterostelium album PN500]